MKRKLAIITLGAGLVLAAGVLMRLGAPVKAQAQRGCTTADARGTYGFQFSGFIRPDPQGPFVPFAESGRLIADAQGTIRGFSKFSAGGQMLEHTFAGTVVVNPDCTATSFIPVDSLGFTDLNSHWVILKPGEEVLLTSLLAGGAVNGRLERQKQAAE